MIERLYLSGLHYGSYLLRPNFLAIFAIPNLIFWTLTGALGTGVLINLLNASLVGISVGVLVAYHQPVVEALFARDQLDGTDWLSLGIFQSWLGSLVLRTGSIAWRMAGRPDAWEVNPSISYGLFLYASAGVCHLAAKGAMGSDKQVPTSRWIRIGALVAFCITVFVMVAWAMKILQGEIFYPGQPLRQDP